MKYLNSTRTIYFIQCGEDGPIKIGLTHGTATKRMRSIQVDSPLPLRLLGTLTAPRRLRAFEVRVHVKFAKHHIRGEWFHPAPELLAFIQSDTKLADLQLDTEKTAWTVPTETEWGQLLEMVFQTERMYREWLEETGHDQRDNPKPRKVGECVICGKPW